MITYPATLDVPRELIRHVGRLLRHERRRIGARALRTSPDQLKFSEKTSVSDSELKALLRKVEPDMIVVRYELGASQD